MVECTQEGRFNSGAECVTSEDRELLCSITKQLTPSPNGGDRPQLIRDINKTLLSYDERKLRFVYFFANGLK